MRITEEQERILGSLHCERLSSNVDNFRLVDDFYNGRNPSIVNTLQNEAYEDDANHRVAYYVVTLLSRLEIIGPEKARI